ncbi:MAG: arsenate reductase (glutaredoxin) [Pseudomonadota bacterium]
MSDVTIYHNPACSKSRQSLALIQEQGITPEVIRYLEQPPSAQTLKRLLQMLGMSPRALLRKGEDAYKARGLADDSLTDEAIVEAMVAEPKLIERPIVVRGDRAVLGRPPENVLDLLRD